MKFLVAADGTVYEGNFGNGRRQGAGVMRYGSGEVPQMDWEAGLPANGDAPTPAADQPATAETPPGAEAAPSDG